MSVRNTVKLVLFTNLTTIILLLLIVQFLPLVQPSISSAAPLLSTNMMTEKSLPVIEPHTANAVTQVLTVGPASFAPSDSSMQYLTMSGTYLTSKEILSSDYYFNAPVGVPHGATITNVTSFWKDNDETLDIEIRLVRSSINAGGTEWMAEASSTGQSGNGHTIDTTIINPLIDYSNYFYMLEVVLLSGWEHALDGGLYSVRVEYTVPVNYLFMPLVLRGW